MARHLTTISCALSVAMATPALSQMRCYPDEQEVLAFMEERYGELATAGGTSTNGHGRPTGKVVLVKTPPDDLRDTWSLLLLLPNGGACLLAAGEGWLEADE